MQYRPIYQFRWLSIIWSMTFIYFANLVLIKLPFISLSFQKHELRDGILNFLHSLIPTLNYEMQIYNIQTISVWACGIVLGPEVGCLTVCFYLILGLLGLPVFAGGGGLDYYKEPTFGYLISLPFNAYLSGWLYQKERKILAVLLPLFITHLVGILYLLFFKQKWFDISWHLSFSMISYDLIFCLILLPLMPFITFILQEMFIQEVPAREQITENNGKSSKSKIKK